MKAKVTEELGLYPVLPLRDVVMFPKMIIPLFVGREKSIKALQNIDKNNKIFLVSQKDGSNDNPKSSDLYKIGVVAKVLQVIKLQDSSVKILVEGLEKAKVIKFISRNGYIKADIKQMFDTCSNDQESLVLRNAVTDLFEEYSNLSKNQLKNHFLILFK